MSDGTTRVFVVDDHPLVRESLARLIDQQADLEVCGEAPTAALALARVPVAQPDVAVVDISLEGRSGLDLIRDLREVCPGVAVLVLSMHDEQLYAERALRLGARGYIMKREATRNVIAAIRRVRDGDLYLSAALAETLAGKAATGNPDADSRIASLSDRELEVFQQIGQGRATRQIAETLNLSPKTVQAYCARIKDKLGLASATEVLREAIRWLEEQSH